MLISLSSAGEADQIASMYMGFGFLVTLIGLENAGIGGGPVWFGVPVEGSGGFPPNFEFSFGCLLSASSACLDGATGVVVGSGTCFPDCIESLVVEEIPG